jgi:hypothetical protein
MLGVLDRIVVKARKAYTSSADDPLHFAKFSVLQAMCTNALFLSLRMLFANSKSDKTTGGAFLCELKNFPDLPRAFRESQKERTAGLGGAVAYSSERLEAFGSNLNRLYDRLYLAKDGKRVTNYELFKEYEKYNFHKDRWADGKKYKLDVEAVKDVGLLLRRSITIRKHKYTINPRELYEILNDFAAVLDDYLVMGGVGTDGVSAFDHPDLGGSLMGVVEGSSCLFTVKLTQKEITEICRILKGGIPVCLKLLHLP